MATGLRISAVLAGAALSLGLAAAPAHASLQNTTSFATWSANVAAPISESATTTSGGFTLGIKSFNFANSIPSTLSVPSTTHGQPLISGASWLGNSGSAVEGSSITISSTGFFPFAFGLFLEGPAGSTFSVAELDSGGNTIGTPVLINGVQDSFFGFYGNLPATVKKLTITDSISNGDGNQPVTFALGDFSSAAAVPEPASVALLGASLLGLGLAKRRKRS